MQGKEQDPVLPRGFLRPCILLLLGEQPAHGYELLGRLRALGFMQPTKKGRYADGGGLYRALHSLEAEGLVISACEHSGRERPGRGGPRRTYALTGSGREELHRRAQTLLEARKSVGEFASRYERAASSAPRRRMPAARSMAGVRAGSR